MLSEVVGFVKGVFLGGRRTDELGRAGTRTDSEATDSGAGPPLSVAPGRDQG